MKKKRFNWAKKHKDWSKDDCSLSSFQTKVIFLFRYSIRNSFAVHPTKLREEHFVQTVKQPDKKMFWGCFSINGPGSLVPVEGMMNSKAYLQIIKRKVCRELSDLHSRAIFQQDSAPCRKAKMTTNCFRKMKITVLDWPGNSPDLNPIENFGPLLKIA